MYARLYADGYSIVLIESASVKSGSGCMAPGSLQTTRLYYDSTERLILRDLFIPRGSVLNVCSQLGLQKAGDLRAPHPRQQLQIIPRQPPRKIPLQTPMKTHTKSTKRQIQTRKWTSRSAQTMPTPEPRIQLDRSINGDGSSLWTGRIRVSSPNRVLEAERKRGCADEFQKRRRLWASSRSMSRGRMRREASLQVGLRGIFLKTKECTTL